MSRQLYNWTLFLLLSFIWGSSFILIKKGMDSLSAFQVASLRIVSAGLILLPLTLKYIRTIPRNRILIVFLSGTLGSLIPSYLFCIAETKIDSALAGIVNALTPVFAIICGAIFFRIKVRGGKAAGIIIAFGGCLLLLFDKDIKASQDLFYMTYAILATVLYGININLVHKYLHGIRSITIASTALSLCAVPAFIMLVVTGYFNHDLTSHGVIISSGASVLLGIAGTAMATILFYMLLKNAGVEFSSMVTYGIPFVALFWGLVAGETITILQCISMLVILAGIYITGKERSRERTIS